ncbi:MAG: ribosome-associated translation inhibitor RaiA [Gaiellaceae bacterium]
MRLQVKGKNVEVSDSIRSYAEQKLSKLEGRLHELTLVEVELTVERNPSIAANQVAEATVWTKGPVLRAREASTDMKASIDQLADKLLRQVKHYRDRRTRRDQRGAAAAADQGGLHVTPDDSPEIVKSKQFAVKPMSAEEAALQLELIGHDFFVFRNADSEDINVLYRRRAGGYGLIEPA